MMRALIVDDSRTMRALLRQHLEALGMTVAEAADADQAELVLADLTPDVALIDWHLPGTPGIELVRRLRLDPARQAMRLIVVSAQTAHERIAEALAAGADEYVMKPFTREMLAGKLALLGLIDGEA